MPVDVGWAHLCILHDLMPCCVQMPQLPPLEEFLPTQTPNPDLPTFANNQALGIPCTLLPSVAMAFI